MPEINISGMEDSVLLCETGNRNLSSFMIIMDRYLPMVSRISYRIMCDRADCVHITKAVFLALWKSPSAFSTASSLRYEIVKRTCLLCRRRLFRRRLLMIFSITPEVYVMSRPSVPSLDEYVARQVWEIFCRASLNCSDRQRVLFTLCELEGIDMMSAVSAGRFFPIDADVSLENARSRIREELDLYGRQQEYASYVAVLRKVEDQLADNVMLKRLILDDLAAFSAKS